MLAGDESAGGHFIRIWGVPLTVLNAAQQLQNGPTQPRYLTLKGGFGPGLPLNNPAQAGTLMVEVVQQCFGNWQGTDLTLDMVVLPAGGTFKDPLNLVLNWQPGQTLAAALGNCFAVALPGYAQNINISPSLVNSWQQQQGGFYPTIRALGLWLRQKTKGALGVAYPGVRIWVNNNTVTASDGVNQKTQPTQLVFTDFVGQPTWLDAATLNAKVAMRGDLEVGQQVQFPQNYPNFAGLVTQSPQQYPTVRNRIAFYAQPWNIVGIWHVGQFRATSGTQWCSVLTLTTSATGQGTAAT